MSVDSGGEVGRDVNRGGGGLSLDDRSLDEVPLERLEAEICGFASRLAAATGQWLVWVGAYDRRKGWEQWEMKSCAQWLSWHCGMSTRVAREHVKVARKLEEARLVRAALLAGELSYSKVRAICRVVEPENEAELVRLADQATASQMDRIVGKMPDPNQPDSAEQEQPLGEVTYRFHGDGTATMSITRPAAEIAAARAAAEAKASEVIEQEQRQGETKRDTMTRLGGLGAIQSDAAIAMVTGEVDAPEGAQARVMIVADIDAMTGFDPFAESTINSRRVDPETIRRLCCDGIIQTAIEHRGEIAAISAESRIVPRRIRRLMNRRDHGMCQFPGCCSTKRLHAHHVIHWANGGKTELSNLISLCHFHHHSVHERGWNIHRNPATGGWTFTDKHHHVHGVPRLTLPTTQPLAPSVGEAKYEVTRCGPAGPLAGLGETCDTTYVASLLIENTIFEKQQIEQDRSQPVPRDRFPLNTDGGRAQQSARSGSSAKR